MWDHQNGGPAYMIPLIPQIPHQNHKPIRNIIVDRMSEVDTVNDSLSTNAFLLQEEHMWDLWDQWDQIEIVRVLVIPQ
jgi:hypothetical protein